MEFEKSRLERLKRALYSRDENVVPKERRTPVHGSGVEVPTNWGEAPSFALPNDEMTKKNNSFFNKFLVFSLVTFLVALVVALFIFFGGLNMISSNNVDIKVAGPASISSGDELDLDISLINQNRAELQNAVLTITYPDSSQQVSDSVTGVATPLVREKIDIGNMKKGEVKDHSLRVLLFGQKDAVKTITFHLDYSIAGSNATFSKEKTYDVTISSSPLLMTVTYPKEINSGQQVPFSVEITSNSSVLVQNALVKIEYPYGFTYTDSNIKPLRVSSTTSTVWSIGDLKNGDKKTLKITGVLVGQNMEDRSFRISLGTASSDQGRDFDADLAVEQATVGIRKSFYNLSVVSGLGSSNAGSTGQSVPVAISWSNTVPDKITNTEIKVTLSGNAFDRNQVSPGSGGFYRSSDNTIVWNKNTTDGLDILSPGDTGQATFSVFPLSDQRQLSAIRNPHIDIHTEMKGTRSGSDTSTITSSNDLTIKFNSSLGISAKTYRTGVFTNTGAVPPRADKETTYTVVLSVSDTTNDLKNTTVSATLPINVVWKGQSSPDSERVVYDPDTRKVAWSLGGVTAGTGFAYSPRTVSFQVGLTPSVSQVGQAVLLTSDISSVGIDTYTGTTLTALVPAVNTRYADPSYKTGDEMVAK